jgi:hypothetical protein
MAFDVEKYKSAKFVRRSFEVNVPELKEFFADGERAVVNVQNLTGPEMAKCEEQANQNMISEIRNLVQAVGTGDFDKIMEGVKTYAMARFEDDEKLSDDLVRRTYQLMYGCPDFGKDRELCIRIRDKHIEVFYRLTNKIRALTGMGFELLGEPIGSSESPA